MTFYIYKSDVSYVLTDGEVSITFATEHEAADAAIRMAQDANALYKNQLLETTIMTNLDPARVARLAGAFADTIHDWTTSAEFAEICRLNAAETNLAVCHSHDFIDANEAMNAAFRSVVGRAPDAASEDDTALMNAAWAQARVGWLK